MDTAQVLPVVTRRGRFVELRLCPNETLDRAPWAVGLFPIGEDPGIAIGVGTTPIAALADALDTLQGGRWAIDAAILQMVKDATGPRVLPRGAYPPQGGDVSGTGGQ
jgi:hypothetical protein